MGKLGLAFKAFFKILRDGAFADRVRAAYELPAAGAEEPAARRSEALTLLATLQREGRLVDFLQEPIAGYQDAQVGAAVRDVHESCRRAVERMFGIEPLLGDEENAEVEVPAGFDPLRFRLGGDVTGEPPYRGRLRHHGWRAARCELPQWSGPSDSALVVAPAEVELKST